MQAKAGTKVPAKLPLRFQARILPARPGDLGQPSFLTNTAISLHLEGEQKESANVRLYDDGQHEDGKVGDGIFGGYLELSQPGKFRYRLIAKAPLSPPLYAQGQLDALAEPLKVTPPNWLSRNIWGRLTQSLTWKICNLTDVPLKGDLRVRGPQEVLVNNSMDLPGGDCQEVNFPLDKVTGREVRAQLLLPKYQEPVWEGQLDILPSWILILWILGGVGLVCLTFILPRRSAQGSILMVVGEFGNENITHSLKIGKNGLVETNNLPSPLNDPGVFQARSGLWRKGIIFLPLSWCQPHFISKTPPRMGNGYLLKRTTTWSCRCEQGLVNYTLKPKW